MPTVRLNAFNVRTLRPTKRTDYADDLQRGLVLRVTPAGGRTFAISYYRGNRKRRYTLGSYPRLQLGQAREEAKRLLARVALGEDPAEARRAEKQASLTVGQLVNSCVAALAIRPSTRKEWERLSRVEIQPRIGKASAASLTRHAIREWAARIVPRSAYTANRAFELLRRAYSWGVETDQIPGSPFAGLKLPGHEKVSDRVLSALEVGAIWRALAKITGQYADATRLLLLTAVRREAVIGMKASELHDLDGLDARWVVPAERSKSGRPHLVPLSSQASNLLRARLALTDGDALFPPARTASVRPEAMWWSSRFVRTLHARAERELKGKMARWTIHNLRHTAATHMAEDLRIDPWVVSLILDHSPGGPAVSRRYNRAEKLPERRTALQSWADWIVAQAAIRGPARVLQHTPRKRR